MFNHYEDNLDRVRAVLERHYANHNVETDAVLLASLANEISNLRQLYQEAVAERERLRLENEVQRRTVLRLEAQYGVLLEQRDEARRETCYVISLDLANGPNLMSPDQVAMEYGWDCFSKDGY